MEFDSYDNGVPCWADVVCPDIEKSATFYRGLFGWDVPEGAPEFGGYRSATMRDRAIAGLVPQMQPGPVVWSSYIAVDDAEATVTAVKAAGGSAMFEPMDVGNLGRMAILVDPANAVFGIWQAGEHKGAGICNEPGTMCWNELITTDLDGSTAFYGTVFGWTANVVGDYTEFQLDGRGIAGMMAKPADMPAEVPPFWGIYFAVADTDATLSRVVELGGTVMMPATDIEPGRFAVVADPNGAAFGIIALRS